MKALTQNEIDRILDDADTRLRAMVLLGFNHGMRASEIVGLRRADLNLESKQITVRRLKHSMTNVQPLTDTEVAALLAWLKVAPKSPFVFPGNDAGHLGRKQMWTLFTAAARAAGCAVTNPHALKHALGYALVARNVTMPVIQQYLGHKNLANTAIYARPNDDMAGRVVSEAMGG